MVLSHAFVHRRHTTDDLNHIHQLVVLASQTVLVKRVYSIVHAQEVHCNGQDYGQLGQVKIIDITHEECFYI